jgi:hypothetical protein
VDTSGRIGVALVADSRGIDLLAEPYARLDLLVQLTEADAEVSRWARAVARTAASPAAVLLVLADEAERASATAWLDAAGLRVTGAATAHEAAEAMAREQPDVVMLDLTSLMPLVRRWSGSFGARRGWPSRRSSRS